MEKIESFYSYIQGKEICFLGIGVSHLELIRQFVQKGAKVTACDKRELSALGETAQELLALGVTLHLGEDYLEHIQGEMVLRTPGLSFFHPKLVEARGKGISITSEMELFFALCPCEIIGITGSDGKTTTTTITAGILEQAGWKVHLGGNIGKPLLYRVGEIAPQDLAVVELSSFQLMSMRQSPQRALITNIAPNHLDVHQGMEEYVAAKYEILRHQSAFSRTVLNQDDPRYGEEAAMVRGKQLAFSLKSPVEQGAWLDANNDILLNIEGNIRRVMNRKDIPLVGLHNVANFMAAICLVEDKVPLSAIQTFAQHFQGVEHRFEFVREHDGVRWYNDAIASSPTRTIAGLSCCEEKIILLAGGYDKQIPFTPLAPVILEKVKHLILMGDTAQKIQAAVEAEAGYVASQITITRVETMEQAVAQADALAQKGDQVALSPACASFDLYANFQQKGNHFKQLVNQL